MKHKLKDQVSSFDTGFLSKQLTVIWVLIGYKTRLQLHAKTQQPRVSWHNFPPRHAFHELSNPPLQANIYPVIVFSG